MMNVALLHLQVRADEGFASSVVEVALHEEVEQMSRVAADGAQFGVTALQNLVAEGRTHIRTALEERTRKLDTHTHHRQENTFNIYLLDLIMSYRSEMT